MRCMLVYQKVLMRKAMRLLLTFFLTGTVAAFQPRALSFKMPRQTLPDPSGRERDALVSGKTYLSAATPTADDSSWTKKRLHNTAAFRSLAILSALALAGVSSSSSIPAQASAAVHVLSFATWFGSVAYTTFIAGITMFKNLPRQTFGKLQGKLFPKYFMLGSVTLVLQLITLSSIAAKAASAKALGMALVMNLVNQFYLEPASTNNMMRRYELEDQAGGQETDEYKKLKATFGKFHGMSSLTNLIALCGGVAHAVYLARSLTV